MDRTTRLVLVRHGHPQGGYGDDHDPGLDDAGRAQADEMATALDPHGPRPVVVSPLRRTRETAAALEDRWATVARVEPRVGEIPSPTDELAARTAWLRTVLVKTWPEMGDDLRDWRARLLDAVRALETDTVVVTHYVAINAIVGAATRDERVICCAPDYCSRTVVDVDGSGLTLVELGAQASTRVR